MSKLNALALSTLICILMISCKKDDAPSSVVPNFSGIYDAAPVIEPRDLAIYTRSGKITDQAFIKTVIQRKVTASFLMTFNIPGFTRIDSIINITSQPFAATGTYNINFNDSGRVSINDPYQRRFTEIISREPFITLKEFDTTFRGPFTGVNEKLLIPVGQFDCVRISAASNNYFCKTRDIFGLGYENDQLYMPLTCMLHFSATSDFSSWGQVAFRFASDAVIGSLNNWDTVIVQENRRALIKR